jgi:hypothetical protein
VLLKAPIVKATPKTLSVNKRFIVVSPDASWLIADDAHRSRRTPICREAAEIGQTSLSSNSASGVPTAILRMAEATLTK